MTWRDRLDGADAASRADSGTAPGSGPGPAGAGERRKGDSRADSPTRPSRRRLLIGAAVLLAGAGAGIAAAAGALPGRDGSAEEPAAFTGATDEITRGDLQGETSAVGTLRFSDSHALRSGFEGVVTRLPAAGTVRVGGIASTAALHLWRRAIGLSLIGGTGTYVVISLLLT